MEVNAPAAVQIPAVAYLRRSTNRQERSLDDQRREIEAYAGQHGYRILRWYTDSGISGDATERRLEFLRMHKAATNGRDFEVILCWDYSRFGRFDSIEAGRWIYPLRQAGVKLVTVAEGLVDWDCFTGRIMNALHAEGKHSFLTDLSRNVSRSLAGIAQQGFLCGQAAPYGYDRMLVDERGEHRQRIRNGERFSKPRSWRTTLVPSDDPIKVSTVRWLFATYADTDCGLRSLADQLNAQGLAGPKGGPWYAASIKAMLVNNNYTGTFTWAKRREGKYHSVAAGQIRERDRAEVTLSAAGKPLAVDNPQEAWIVVEKAHEALVTQELFERIQTKIHDRRRSKAGVSYRSHTKENGDAFLLSGLVYCARCGCKMHGATLQAKGHSYPKYVCSTYCRSGKNNPHGCGCHGMHQDQLVDVLVRKLQDSLLTPRNLERLQSALRAQLGAQAATSPAGLEAMRKQVSELNREIDRAAENFLRAPAEVLDLIGAKLTAMKRQRDQLQEQIRRAKAASQPRDVEAQVQELLGRIEHLGQELTAADPARRREVFRLFVSRIDLSFGRVERGKRTECPFESGQIHLRTGEDDIFGSVSRGDRI